MLIEAKYEYREEIMRQTKIARWLKGLVIVLVALGVLFWGWMISVSVYIGPVLGEVTLQDRSIIVTAILHAYAGFFYFAILAQFWKVCTEIGRDNSFSMENVKSFHLMSIFGGAEAIGFVVRIVLDMIDENVSFLWVLFPAAETFVTVVFLILCEALSQLILNAYEVKKENELTI